MWEMKAPPLTGALSSLCAYKSVRIRLDYDNGLGQDMNTGWE